MDALRSDRAEPAVAVTVMDDRAERVILIDPSDREIGTAPKLEAHREGRLHRALSVIVRDAQGRVLLQRRHVGKYHSGGLWTNTCCSHPRPGEPVQAAAARRLDEEMGIVCPLTPLMTVAYHAEVGNGLIENELVHVFAGRFDGPVRPQPLEADGYAWVDAAELAADLAARPAAYSVWFRKYCAESWSTIFGAEPWATLAAA